MTYFIRITTSQNGVIYSVLSEKWRMLASFDSLWKTMHNIYFENKSKGEKRTYSWLNEIHVFFYSTKHFYFIKTKEWATKQQVTYKMRVILEMCIKLDIYVFMIDMIQHNAPFIVIYIFFLLFLQ